MNSVLGGGLKYYYGGRNASHNRIGRLMMREDGTGAIEYFYGKIGEVTKTRRTMIVPNQAIATYVTQWTYDSHNRLLEMIYPDEEKITYSYNLGGQLEKVHGYKSYGYDYVSKIGYDKFEQRTYLKYCNGAETFYTYDPQRRRLQNLMVNSGGNTIMDNAYTYDAVSNVLSVINGASVPKSGKAGGQMAHTYTYDALYRLVSATGTYTGADNKTASYTLAMGYDNMHRITSKRQILTQNNVQFNGTLNAGYDLSYTYGTDTGKKFQLANVKDVNYRTEETPSESENVNNNHAYEYDANAPSGMTVEQFDEMVIKTGNSFGNNPNITYCLEPFEQTQGNCNSSSSTLLYKAGVPLSRIKDLRKQISGLVWGFGDIKPWTVEEQSKAVQRQREFDQLRNEMMNTIILNKY